MTSSPRLQVTAAASPLPHRCGIEPADSADPNARRPRTGRWEPVGR